MNLKCTDSKNNETFFYLTGHDLLCGIEPQKSNYADVYYVNYYYFIGEFDDITGYPTHYESDIHGRITVMSRKQTSHGKQFMTAQIEYEEYTEEGSTNIIINDVVERDEGEDGAYFRKLETESKIFGFGIY